MANLLEGLNVIASTIPSFIGGTGGDIAGAALSTLGLQGPGSVPRGLKYAEAGDPPKAAGGGVYKPGYDLTFYIQRADGGGAGELSSGTGLEDGVPRFSSTGTLGFPDDLDWFTPPAGASTGPEAYKSVIQSPYQQVAMAKTFETSPGFGSIMGPGLKKDLKVDLGPVSQASVATASVKESVSNMTKRVASSTSYARSAAASEKLFSTSLFESFNPEETVSTLGTVTGISKSISRGAYSDISPQLARLARFPTSVQDLTEFINNGITGVSTPAAVEAMNRMGPQGLLALTKNL